MFTSFRASRTSVLELRENLSVHNLGSFKEPGNVEFLNHEEMRSCSPNNLPALAPIPGHLARFLFWSALGTGWIEIIPAPGEANGRSSHFIS